MKKIYFVVFAVAFLVFGIFVAAVPARAATTTDAATQEQLALLSNYLTSLQKLFLSLQNLLTPQTAYAQLPAPTAGDQYGGIGYFGAPSLSAGYSVPSNIGQYTYQVRFMYDASSTSYAQSFRVYQKKPGDSSFGNVATFSSPYSVVNPPLTGGACSNTLYAGDWILFYCASGSLPGFWAAQTGSHSSSYYPVGEYDLYVVAVDQSGTEGQPSATMKLFNLDRTTITSPIGTQTTATPTFTWTVASGWPQSPSYHVVVHDGSTVVWDSSVSVAAGASSGSKTYDGPALSSTKTYTVFVDAPGLYYGGAPYTAMNAATQTFTLPQSCSLTVSVAATTPAAQNINPGQSAVPLVKFNATPNCNGTLNSFAVSLLPMPSGYQNISALRLYNDVSGVQLGTTQTVTGASVNFASVNMPLTANQALVLKVVGDVSPSAGTGSAVYGVFGGSWAVDGLGGTIGNNASGNIIAGNTMTVVSSYPAPPSNITVWWDQAEQHIKFSFTDNASNESWYQVGIKRTSDSVYNLGSPWVYNYPSVSGSGTTYTGSFYPGPSPLAGTYNLRVTDYDASGQNSPWVESSGTVTVPSSSLPPAPSTPTPTSYSGWIGTSYIYTTILYPSPSGYQVKATFDWGDGTTSDTSYVTPSSGGTSVTAIHSWSTGGVYSVKAKAVDTTNSLSSWSSAASMTIGTPSSAASNLTGTVSGSTVYLNWIDNSTNETGFKLYGTRGGLSTDIGNVGQNVTSYADSGLAAGTYDYKVQTFNLSGGGTYPIYSTVSNVFTVTVGGGDTSPPSTPPVPVLNIIASPSQINLSWGASTDNVGVTGYKIYRCVCGNTANMVYLASVVGTSYSDTGLAGFTTYTYAVAAYDAAGNNSAQGPGASGTTFGSDATAPSTPTGLSATAISSVQINLSWNASTDNVGVAGYKVYRNGSYFISTTNTFINNGGLPAGTSYSYTVAAYDAAGNVSAQSGSVSATTQNGGAGTPTSPTINVPSSSGIPVYVSWSSASGALSYNLYHRTPPGTGTSGWISVPASYLTVTSYSDSSVTAGSNYEYKVDACNSYGCIESNYGTVSVSGGIADTTSPSTPTGVSAVAISSSQINLSWNASTDNVGVAGYKIYRGGTFLTSVGASTYAYSDTGLSAATSYSYTVSAYDAAGNISPQSSAVSATTQSVVSVINPPTLNSITTTQNPIGLSWSSVSGATWYHVYRRTPAGTGIWPTTTTGSSILGTSWNDPSVSPGTSYEYYVVACNSTGSCSVPSNYQSVTVASIISDTTPPSTPTGLAATAVTTSSVSISWNASTDNVGVTMYKVFKNGSFFANTFGATSTYFTDTVVSPGTAYGYAVTALDAATNQSAQSASLYVTVPSAADTTPPSVPGSITASPNPGQVYLSWSASTDNVGVAGYKIFKNGVYIVSSTSVSYYDYAVSAGATYSYYVKAYDTAGNESAQSATISATVPSGAAASSTTSSTTAPNAPSNFTYNFSNSGATVNLIWQDNSTNENWFTIYRQFNGTWSTIGQVGANVTAFSDSPSAGTYYYQVSACGSTLCSAGVNLGPLFVGGTSTTPPPSTGGGGMTPPSSQPPSPSTPPASSTTPIGTFLKGIVTDSSQKPVQGVYVHVFTSDFTLNFSAITDANGSYGVSLPAGTYFVEISPPSTRTDLLKPAPQSFNITNGATITINLQFGAVSKIITGKTTFSNGQPITDAEVGAYSSVTNQWISTFTDGSGNFALRVSGGTWQVGIRPRDAAAAKWSWTGNFPTAIFANDATSETRTINFTIAISDAKLTVHTVDQDGAVLANAGVIVDVISAAQKPPEGSTLPPSIFRKSGGDGQASFVLKPGTYYVRAFLPPELGLFNPDEQTVILAQQQAKDITLIFHKQIGAATVMLKGKSKLDDGSPTDAFIWAWSEKGEATQLRSNANGDFNFPATAGRWHIGAGKEAGGIPYKSSEMTIDVENGAALVEIVLSRFGQASLAPPVVVSQPSSQQIIAQSQDGAKVTVPESAAVSTGNVSVQVKPTIEAPSQANAKVVSTVYEVSIKDASGTAVTSLQKDIEITIPYKDEDLKDQKITTDSLVPSYYDESAGTWVKVDNYTIDKEKHVVIARVKHLTRFALVAAADITPPDAPANISAKKGASGEVVISWTNPTSDFDHVKVYRSTTASELGKIVANNVTVASAFDTDVVSGTKYYYTVRSVDPAGNESTNANQVSVTASGVFTGTTLPPGQGTKLAILRKLTAGSNGDDVKTLQAALLKEGVYPEGLITGYFGKLTKQAVIRFQEKYADEILKPNDLDHGTGIVGPSTRAKLNKLP